jgi:hypothetical protein
MALKVRAGVVIEGSVARKPSTIGVIQAGTSSLRPVPADERGYQTGFFATARHQQDAPDWSVE